jgi:hypothetical protein
MHPVQEDVKAAIHEGMDLLGIEVLREAGESGHVGKQDGDLLALPFERTAGGQDLLGQMARRVAQGCLGLRGGRLRVWG